MIVFLFSSDRFSWNMHCIMTTKLDIVTIFVFRTVILPKPENVLGITYPCFSMLPAQITAKLYTHSQIGFVNYTKQLLLNEYSNTRTVMYVNVLKRDAFFDLFYLFSIILYIFANTGKKTRLFL